MPTNDIFSRPTSDSADDVFRRRRLDTLLYMAFLMVIACFALVVLDSGLNEFSKAVVSLILGRFLGYVDSIYSVKATDKRKADFPTHD